MTQDISLDLIDRDPHQARHHFDDEGLKALAESMSACGQAVPILVRPDADRFILVHGERRVRAAKILGWPTIRSEVRVLSQAEALWLSLSENLTRADLTPSEEAEAYRRALDAGITQAELGRRLGKTQSYISHKLRLLTLPPPVVLYLDREALSEGHAKQLLRLRDFYTPELPASFKHWKEAEVLTTLDLEDPATFLRSPEYLFAVLVKNCCPEEKPMWWFIEKDPDAEPVNTIIAATAVFCRWVAEQGHEVRQWEVAAFWWGSLAVRLSATVVELHDLISGYEDRTVSAVLMLLGDKGKPPKPNGPKSSEPYDSARDWWGWRTDLSKARALHWIQEPPAHILERVEQMVRCQENPLLSSALQG